MTQPADSVPTLARLCFWPPTANPGSSASRLDDFGIAYEKRIVPLLKKHGLEESNPSGRATADRDPVRGCASAPSAKKSPAGLGRGGAKCGRRMPRDVG